MLVIFKSFVALVIVLSVASCVIVKSEPVPKTALALSANSRAFSDLSKTTSRPAVAPSKVTSS